MKRRSFLTALAGVPILGRLFAREAEATPHIDPFNQMIVDCNKAKWPEKYVLPAFAKIDGFDLNASQILVHDEHGNLEWRTLESC